MSLSQLYKRGVIYPSFISLALAFIFSVFTSLDYKSEWLTPESVMIMSMVSGAAFCLVICILSTPIYLNQLEAVKKSKALIFLTWFLLPIGFIILIFYHDILHRLENNVSFGTDFIFLVVLSTPFILGLLFTYLEQVTSHTN